jgi:signal transduction histidine kinase/DNA-binding response OmpR family regulator
MKRIIIFLVFPFFAISQNQKQIDSVSKIIKKSSTNIIKSKESLVLAKLVNDNNLKLKLINESLQYAELARDNKSILFASLDKAAWLEKNKNSDEAVKEYKKALKRLENSEKYKITINDYLADIYKRNSQIDSATYYTNKSIVIAKRIKNDLIIASEFLKLGNYAFYMNDFKNAFIQYSKSDSICAKNDSLRISSFRAKIYNYLGYAVRKTHGYDKTLEYYLKSKELYKKLNDTHGEQEINIGLAQLYTNEGKYIEALPLLNEAVKFQKTNAKDNAYTYAIICRGYLLIKMKRFEEAERDYQEYYDISFQGNDITKKKWAMGYLAYLYKSKKDYNKAEQFYNKTLDMCKDDYDSNKLSMYEEIIDLYKETDNTNKLVETYSEYIKLRDTLDKENKNKEIFELETKYQTEKKEQEIKLLSEVAQKQKIIYLSIVGLLIALGTFLFFGYRNKIKTAAKINELNELKSRFFANISHEFRTPLTLIKSPVQSLQNEIKDENQKIKLNLIDKNSNRMLELVDQLLELSKLDSGKLQLILKEVNISSFLNSIAEPFQYQAKENKIEFETSVAKTEQNYSIDKDVVEKITTNLLSNALKYTAENEKISFDSTIDNNQLKLIVSNSGTTIKKEEVSKLFERFYQKKENQQGIGIGLALVKELVELYNGTIETKIENGILSFVVTLPIQSATRNTIENEEIIIDSKELPILLVVDDNQDIREVLKELFKTNFHVIEAKDGEQALHLALKEIPDCIISDVMMPKMNGFEFAKAIKSNELTSFIPVVLLTAKTSDEAHLEGLKSTADAYLTKPFNNDIVKETVNQLITERKKLHDRYSQELVLKPTDIVINSVDEKFLEKLQIILNEELSNADFTSDDFASKMGISRMQLHRKLKSLLGVSATEFLRKERLKMAAHLLEKGNGNISEIIYSVGFNDVSYFNRCFKEMYHCTPSEYQSKN